MKKRPQPFVRLKLSADGKGDLLAVDIPFLFVSCGLIRGKGVTQHAAEQLCLVLLQDSHHAIVACGTHADVVGDLKAAVLTHGLYLGDHLAHEALLHQILGEIGIQHHGNTVGGGRLKAGLLDHFVKHVLHGQLNIRIGNIEAYGDLNKYFDKFSPGDEVSGFGRVLPLDAQDGWFKAENAGKYKDQIHFVTSFHGGIIYVRKNNTENEVCHKVYDLCMDILKDYSDYDFYYFKKPADEPIYGLALAVANCKPTKVGANHFCFFPETRRYKSNIIKGKLSYDFLGEEIRGDGMLCHFGNYNTVKQPYLAEVEKLNAVLEGRKFDAWKIHIIWSIKNMVGETEAAIKKLLGIKRK